MNEQIIEIMVPLFWSLLSTLIIELLWTKWLLKIKTYHQIGLATMTRQELLYYEAKDSRGLQRVVKILDKGSKVLNLEGRLYKKLDRMLHLMGHEHSGQEAFARFLLSGLLGALPILVVPVITKHWFLILLYPFFSLLIMFQEYQQIKKAYKSWQQDLTKDIPEVIDRLRISFVVGRDYISVLKQAAGCSGPAMAHALDQLINDIQTLGSIEAIRLFTFDFDLPIMGKLASALTLVIESGYAAAEAYFVNIESDILALRKDAIEAMTRSKPEKVYKLYILLFVLSIGALVLKGWEIFQQVSVLFM